MVYSRFKMCLYKIMVVGENESLPSLWFLVGLRGRSATLKLRQGSGFLSQQWGILDNMQKHDPVILREWGKH